MILTVTTPLGTENIYNVWKFKQHNGIFTITTGAWTKSYEISTIKEIVWHTKVKR